MSDKLGGCELKARCRLVSNNLHFKLILDAEKFVRGSFGNQGSGCVEKAMPPKIPISVEIVAIALLQGSFFHQEHLPQGGDFDCTYDELLLVDVSLLPDFSGFTSVLFPVHEVMGPFELLSAGLHVGRTACCRDLE